MIADDLYKQWKEDEAAPFAGWDFSYLDDRMVEQTPPWDYENIARGYVENAEAILDIATGGGEVLSKLGPFPDKAIAIEDYEPNVFVARERLAPLGVEVTKASAVEQMPFADASFDLVVNRHGGFHVPKVHRVLQPGGYFVTQQVGGDNLVDLMEVFDTKPKWPEHTLKNITQQMEEIGFKIDQAQEWEGEVVFKDVGAIVYFLKAVPWTVDDFSVDSHMQQLESLQDRLKKDGKLSFTYKRFLLTAEKL